MATALPDSLLELVLAGGLPIVTDGLWCDDITDGSELQRSLEHVFLDSASHLARCLLVSCKFCRVTRIVAEATTVRAVRHFRREYERMLHHKGFLPTPVVQQCIKLTCVTNAPQISEALRASPDLWGRFVSTQLGAPIRYTETRGWCIPSAAIQSRGTLAVCCDRLRTLLSCGCCELPTLRFVVHGTDDIRRRCFACGAQYLGELEPGEHGVEWPRLENGRMVSAPHFFKWVKSQATECSKCYAKIDKYKQKLAMAQEQDQPDLVRKHSEKSHKYHTVLEQALARFSVAVHGQFHSACD